MSLSAGYSKNPLNSNPFCETASAEPPFEWSKWAAIHEVRIEVQNLLRLKLALIEPKEPIYEAEITGETEAKNKNCDISNQEKRVGCENRVLKAREKGVLCNSLSWGETDAKVQS